MVKVSVTSKSDAIRAQLESRSFARSLGFSGLDLEAITLAASELAMNLARYAQGGMILLRPLGEPDGAGLEIVSSDDGPGIPDLDLAMQDGFSTGGGFGDGLPTVRRLMDEFEISSSPSGTRVVVRKWKKAA